MALPTRHLRWKDGALQQLFMFDEDDRNLVEAFALNESVPSVFGEHYTPLGWLENSANYEWRKVPTA